MRLFDKSKLFYLIVIVFSMIFMGVFLSVNNDSSKYNMSFIINSFFMNFVESDEYKAGFEETSYKNYKILHKKDLEPSLPMIFNYLDKLEEKSEDILGYTPTTDLTIQFDYDERIFKKRHSTFADISDVAGYYNTETNTIYMYVEDVYRDIIMNMPKSEYVSTEIIISSRNFKEILSHEYSHHIYKSFIKYNNIESENLPTWLDEGTAEYIANATTFDDKELDFIPLNKLNNNSEWVESININDNVSPYIQSYYTVYSMINSYNKNVLKDLIINCKDETFEESFKTVTNLSIDEFEEKIKSDFNNFIKIQYEINNSEDTSEYDKVKVICLENYIKVDEDDIRAYETLSNYYEYHENDFDKVVNFLKESIEKHPKESFLLRRLAIAYEDNNMIDLAEECFDRADVIDKK